MDESARQRIEFESAFNLFRSVYDRYQAFALQNGFFLSVVIGWEASLSAEDSYIGQSQVWWWASSVVIMFYTLVHSIWCARFAQRSDLCYQHLTNLGITSTTECLESYRVTDRIWRSAAAIHALLACFVVYINFDIAGKI